jgi:hypothetical protein
MARTRAQDEERDNVVFVAGDCRNVPLADGFDAAVGRFVLVFTGDATETLQTIVDRVKPGGVVAFAEADFSSVLGYMHAGPAGVNRSLWDWMATACQSAGLHTAMAPHLNRAFIAAGLGVPEMALQAPICGADGWAGYQWAAATLRSMLPVLEEHGIVTADVLAPESLAARCRAEVAKTGVPFMLLPLVTAWARKPLVA